MSSLTASAVSVETEAVSDTDNKTARTINVRRGEKINIPTMPEGELAINKDEEPTLD